MDPSEDKQSQTHLIQSLYIEDLFCSYTYQLTLSDSFFSDNDKIMLLYGNNGAGKTTILNIIYHMLHPEPYGGHRSHIARIPFKKFEVNLSSNYKICLIRDTAEDKQYRYLVYDSDDNLKIDWEWRPETNRRNEVPKEDEQLYSQLCEYLRDLNISFHYLKDSRRVEGDDYQSERRKIRYFDKDREMPIYITEQSHKNESYSPTEILMYSINRAENWFRQQTLSGTNVGSATVNSIYKDLIKTVVTIGKSSQEGEVKSITDLRSDLSKLANRTANYAQFGLTPELDIEEIIAFLDKASSTHTELLSTVLVPFLDGHNARLDALQDVQGVMSNFVELLGEFYSEKNVNIHLKDGLEIISKRGQKLSPALLSSGEKQLLLLLCHAISARKRGTIFIIDEPEISLNVKWQRKIIPALLTCLAGTDSQVILATHSIELLSQYNEYVTPLDNLTI